MKYRSSEQAVGWFKDVYSKGALEIRPPYQRKPVWAARQKCYFIESVLMKFPVPEVYIQQLVSPDGAIKYAVVDGQQRIRTILQFIGSDTDPGEQEHNKFVLDKLKEDSYWKNKGLTDLTDEEKKEFFGYAIAVRYLNTDQDSDVREAFSRINEFLTPLKPQELRNSRYIGPFALLSVELADTGYFAENGIVSTAAIRRMGDVEFVSELLIGIIHGPQGGSAQVIDEYYRNYEDFEDEFPNQARTKRTYTDTLNEIQKLFPEIKSTRWGNKTDFYSLFVALAYLFRSMDIPDIATYQRLKDRLLAFAEEVDRRLGDEEAEVSKESASYVAAVKRGANDKARRGTRHVALIDIIQPLLRPRQAGKKTEAPKHINHEPQNEL